MKEDTSADSDPIGSSSILAKLLATVAVFVFLAAIVLPFFTIIPSFGDPLLDAIMEEAEPGVMDPRSYSVIGGIAGLFEEQEFVIGTVILVFSVVFPIVKMTLLWTVLIRPAFASPRLLRALEVLGPWSMADVFVVSVMLLSFKSFPGGTKLVLEPGYYLYLISVVSSLVSTMLVVMHGHVKDGV